MKKTCYLSHNYDYRILVMHQLLDTSFFGVQHYVFRKSDPNVLPLDKIDSKFNYLALGHIHTYQKIQGLENKGIHAIYSGSIERTSFAERLEKKGYVEVEVKQIEKENSTIHETRYDFIELPTRPMYLFNLEFDCEYLMDDLLEEIDKNISTLNNESLVYLRITGKIKNLSWDKLRNHCLKWKEEKLIKNFKLKLNEEFRNY